MKSKKFKTFSLLISLFLILSFLGCSKQTASDKTTDKKKVIKLGTLSTIKPFMTVLKGELEKKGYKVEIVMFDANNMPATATKDGSIDGFIHNHRPWIQTFNKESNSKLEMVKPYLFYYRAALYSSKHKSINEFPNGAQIAIPNDPTNVENSLLMLQKLGLLTLGDKKDKFYTPIDIKENPKNIKILETEITTTARSINDADAVICPAIRIKAAGIDPKSFIAEDTTTTNFPVGLTVDSKNINEPWVKDATEILQSDAVRTKFNEMFGGTMVLYNK